MKHFTVLFFTIFFLTANAQTKKNNLDYRVGIGNSFHGTGDVLSFALENELSMLINNYFGSSIILVVGKNLSNRRRSTTAFVAGGVNMFFSPFKNTQSSNFKIGAGLSFLNNTYSYLQTPATATNHANYIFEYTNTYGLNIILELTQKLNEKTSIGIKVFSQSYLSGDIISGYNVKFGLAI